MTEDQKLLNRRRLAVTFASLIIGVSPLEAQAIALGSEETDALITDNDVADFFRATGSGDEHAYPDQALLNELMNRIGQRHNERMVLRDTEVQSGR